MIETGDANKVKVMSIDDFMNLFFKYDSYKTLRATKPFGSAVNPLTGESDETDYIPVTYYSDDSTKKYTIEKITDQILKGGRTILIGDYGTGKSRCIHTIFKRLNSTESNCRKLVLAINLRDHWGASSAAEIIAGHLEELGLSGTIDNAMQIITSGGAILLLDGVDEVGAQTFGNSRENRKSVRKIALEGIRKLISLNSKNCVLLTSRSHYFDSDQEMISSLGLATGKAPEIIRCPEEFNSQETALYLKQIKLDVPAPDWLPRKPLVFQVLSTIEKAKIIQIFESSDGEVAFWKKFITAICIREANIHGSLEPETVREILKTLAESTRNGNTTLGRLSVKTVREAYEKVLQDTPDQAGEQMLMRLCTLGRVDPSSPERQFVDEYIVDRLRSESLISAIEKQDKSIGNTRWKQPLLKFGWELLAETINSLDQEGHCKSMLANLENKVNHQAYIEILSVVTAKVGSEIECHNLTVEDIDIHHLCIGKRRIKNLSIKSSYIRNLEILPEESKLASDITLSDCQIINLDGISSDSGLPKWISRSEIETFDSMSTSKRIKNSSLSSIHILFLAIIQKIFFQSGAGREEKSLLKGGFGQKYEPKALMKILNLLIREGLVEKINGDDGYIYKPVRKYVKRMSDIKAQLALSDDPLWEEIGKLEK